MTVQVFQDVWGNLFMPSLKPIAYTRGVTKYIANTEALQCKLNTNSRRREALLDRSEIKSENRIGSCRDLLIRFRISSCKSEN